MDNIAAAQDEASEMKRQPENENKDENIYSVFPSSSRTY